MPSVRLNAILHQALALLPITILQTLTGCIQGGLPVAIYYLRSLDTVNRITETEGNWIACFQQLGKLFIAIPAGLIADKIGRKWTTIICGILCSCSWFLITLNNDTLLFYILYFMLGIVQGIVNTIFQVYLTEIVSAKYRGVFASLGVCYLNLGNLMTGVIGAFLSYEQMNFITWCFSMTFFGSIYWIFESPYYLLSKNRENDAKKNLEWLRYGYSKEQIETEFFEIKSSIDNQKKYVDDMNLLERILVPTNLKCLLVVTILTNLVTFNGHMVIRLNSAFIFPTTEFIKNPAQYPVIITFVELCCCFGTPLIIDKINRKTLAIFSATADALILFLMSGLYYLYTNNHDINIPYIGSILFGIILIYCAIFIFALRTSIVLLKSEILPQSVRSFGSGVCVITQSLSAIICVQMFQYIGQSIGTYFNFIVFGISSVFIMIVVHFWLPETRGRTLADVQNKINNKKNTTNNSIKF